MRDSQNALNASQCVHREELTVWVSYLRIVNVNVTQRLPIQCVLVDIPVRTRKENFNLVRAIWIPVVPRINVARILANPSVVIVVSYDHNKRLDRCSATSYNNSELYTLSSWQSYISSVSSGLKCGKSMLSLGNQLNKVFHSLRNISEKRC